MTNYREYQKVLKLSFSDHPATVTPPASSPESSPHLAPRNLSPEPKKKITRTKTGCFCCRRRKKKCDERKPACSGCIRNMLTCVYPDESQISKPKRQPKSQPAEHQHIQFTPLSPICSPEVKEREYTMERREIAPQSVTPKVCSPPKFRYPSGISIKSLLN